MNEIYWKTNSFKYKKKGVDWYWIVWSISSLIIFSVYYFLEDNVFAIMIFFLTLLITMASFKKPTVNKYLLKENCIFIEHQKKEILFKDIESYNIDIENLKILVHLKNTMSPLLHIPFQPTQNISKIDDFLSSKIKKDSELRIPLPEILINRIIGL